MHMQGNRVQDRQNDDLIDEYRRQAQDTSNPRRHDTTMTGENRIEFNARRVAMNNLLRRLDMVDRLENPKATTEGEEWGENTNREWYQ